MKAWRTITARALLRAIFLSSLGLIIGAIVNIMGVRPPPVQINIMGRRIGGGLVDGGAVVYYVGTGRLMHVGDLAGPIVDSSFERYYSLTLLQITNDPLIVFATLTATMTMLVAKRFKSSRYAPGHCVTCGYDLRGPSERCPECGTPIDAQISGKKS